jgi:hypothetical protein
VVIAGKQDDHVASEKEFARRGHLAISNQFTYARIISVTQLRWEDSKTPRGGFDLCPDWPRSSPFR